MKQGKKGDRFRRLFYGPGDEDFDAPQRTSSDELEPEDTDFGMLLGEDGTPFLGINPNPKYYIVPKESPKSVPPKEEKTAVPATVKVKVKKPMSSVKVTVKKKRNENS